MSAEPRHEGPIPTMPEIIDTLRAQLATANATITELRGLQLLDHAGLIELRKAAFASSGTADCYDYIAALESLGFMRFKEKDAAIAARDAEIERLRSVGLRVTKDGDIEFPRSEPPLSFGEIVGDTYER